MDDDKVSFVYGYCNASGVNDMGQGVSCGIFCILGGGRLYVFGGEFRLQVYEEVV